MATARFKCIPNWQKCASCQAILHKDDIVSHSTSHCPPVNEKTDRSYSYIYEKKLFSFLKIFESQGNEQGKNELFYNDVIQISLAVAQLCDLPIGDPVLIKAKNDQSIVKLLWPVEDNLLSSVFLTKQSLWELNCSEGPVKIQKIENAPTPAQDIVLELIKPDTISETQLMELTEMLSAGFNNRIILNGQYLVFNFYGLRPKLQVISINDYLACEDPVENVTKNVAEMGIEAKENGRMFKVVPNTKWKIRTALDEENCKSCCDKYCLSNLGGIDKMITELTEVMYHVLSSEFIEGQNVSCGIIIHGVSGTGKSYLARAMVGASKLPVINIHSWQIFSKYFGEAEARMKALFDEAIEKAPSVIVIDELDTFCPGKSGSDQEKRVFGVFLSMLDKLNDYKVVVIGTTRQLDSIDSALRRPGRFDYEIEIPVPNAEARTDILKRLLASYRHEISEETITALCQTASHGYVGSDLSLACTLAHTRAANDANEDSGPIIKKDHLVWAFSQVKPSAMREIMIEIPNVKWTDIGGQDELKLKLQQVLEWPLKHPEAFTRLGISPPRGILLFGPPGCSKTMIAKAVASESKLNFIAIKGADLFSKWVGESEKAVREVFRKAQTVSPSVVFFDEIDAITVERETDNTSGSNVQERVLSQLLTELDGIQPLSNVTIIAATNRPDRIDSALLRPGRLDRKLYVPLPNADTRKAILSLQFKKTPIEDDVHIGDLVELTEGYSGAEIIAVCHEAAMRALQEDLSTEKVSRSNFDYALSVVKPRTPKSLLEIYEKFLKNK